MSDSARPHLGHKEGRSRVGCPPVHRHGGRSPARRALPLCGPAPAKVEREPGIRDSVLAREGAEEEDGSAAR